MNGGERRNDHRKLIRYEVLHGDDHCLHVCALVSEHRGDLANEGIFTVAG